MDSASVADVDDVGGGAAAASMSPQPFLGFPMEPVSPPQESAVTAQRREHGAQRGAEDHDPEIRSSSPAQSTTGNNWILDEGIIDQTPVLGCRYSSTQWRPEKDKFGNVNGTEIKKEDEEVVVKALGKAIDRLAVALAPSSKYQLRPILPKYEGLEWENPEKFLCEIRRTCKENKLTFRDWTEAAADQLRGGAYAWYENYKAFGWDFETFSRRLLDRFDNEEEKARLRAKFFGHQQENEEATKFISGKVAILQRLELNMDEATAVVNIRALLHPKITLNLIGRTIKTVEDLMEYASEIERNLVDIDRRSGGVSPPRREVRLTHNPRPAYPCRYCGQDHFNRDCPTRREVPSNRKTSALPAIEPTTSSESHQGNAGRSTGR